ncbi:unknown [Clostridium sp. CAG:354]|jgi:LPXTG-motif cell wall-anchored protein|nr:LPXTG cell wall anchor domain-containing protein [Clostridium sp.]MBS5864564.1 LPXTG cell wall anchor domain-containing protein [Clostridium sp.]MEE0268824.1 LPXTG cell wall anchor domain-containing protein [Clostridia bacterium]CDE10582.1 unknown [Clostridium sp. CAG:354]
MKRNSLIKGILLVTIVAILMLITNSVYAADTIVLSPTDNNTATDNSAVANNSALTSTLTPTTPVNNTSTLNSNLPKTGIADNTVVFIVVGVCAVAAIYAYKKVRDYKGI